MLPAEGYDGGPSVLSDAGMPNCNVYVSLVPTGINEAQFQHLFQPYGNVISMRLIPSKQMPGKVCGFIRYTSIAEARFAVAAMHGRVINGQKMKVKFSQHNPY